MNHFIETICLIDGVPQHLPWHQARVDLTFRLCMNYAIPFSIEAVLEKQTNIPRTGKVKCTIEYGAVVFDVRATLYEATPVRTVKLVEIPEGYDYRFKYADRTMIDRLYAWREDADDILMTRDGWITDTSVANIAFLKNERWYTPAQPLLAGTTWKRLVAGGILIPKPIHRRDFDSFERWRVFNTMNNLEM